MILLRLPRFAITGFSAFLLLNIPAQELVTNGSFENTGGSFAADGNGIMSLPIGATNIPGWTSVNGELAWVTNGNVFGAVADNGSMSLDLSGYHDSAPHGGVSQAMATTPGERYRVALSVGVYMDSPSFRGPVTVRAIAGHLTNSYTVAAPGVGNQWGNFDLTFTAESSATPITLTGVSSGGGSYLGLDHVSLRDAGGGPELLLNGDFDDIDGTFQAPSGVMSLMPGATNIPGWQVTGAETAWANNQNSYGPKTPFGLFFLDLTGFHDFLPYGGVTQTASTVAGNSYQLSFAIGSHQDYAQYKGPVAIGVTAGSRSNLVTFTPVTAPTGSFWMSFSFEFVANSATTPLMLIGETGGQYIGLDNVSVVPAASALRITSIEAVGTDLKIRFISETGKLYAVQSRNDLETGAWTRLAGTITPGSGGVVEVVLPNAVTGLPRRFFRIQTLL